MSILGPMRNSVGIREVRSDGVALDGAMVLDVIGAGVSFVAASGNSAAKYVLTMTAGVTFAAVKAALALANSSIDIASQKITSLGTPTNAGDAATKAYVDTAAAAKVASVSGSAPIVSSGGTTPAISITAASGGAAGSMSAAHYTKLEGVEAGAQATSFAHISAALSSASGNVSFNSVRLTNVSDPVDAQDAATKAYVASATPNPYGTLIEELSVNMSFAATETLTVHTITPVNDQVTTYKIVWRAVPAVNNGSGGGLLQETIAMVRKDAGTVTVSTMSTPVQLRINTLASASGSVSASAGDLLIRFATVGGAATLTRCDVYADEST